LRIGGLSIGDRAVLQQMDPFPDDYEDLYQQMLSETQQPGFVATSRILTAWGTKPPTFSPLIQP